MNITAIIFPISDYTSYSKKRMNEHVFPWCKIFQISPQNLSHDDRPINQISYQHTRQITLLIKNNC